MTQYESILNDVNQIVSVFRDMEGGLFMLAIFSEILMDLQEMDDTNGCDTVIRKLYETACVPVNKEYLSDDVSLIIDFLEDTLDEYGVWFNSL